MTFDQIKMKLYKGVYTLRDQRKELDMLTDKDSRLELIKRMKAEAFVLKRTAEEFERYVKSLKP